MTVADLLRGLLLASANDAAATLAARVGGSNRGFVALMNRRARELGLTHTHYANAIGLDALGNYSSAEDLVKLTLILRRNAFFRAVTDLPRATLRSGSHAADDRQPQPARAGRARGQRGQDRPHDRRPATSSSPRRAKNGITVISVVLDEPSEAARDQDSLALIRYGLGRYHRAKPVRKGEAFASVKLAHRDERAQLVAARTVVRTARRGEQLPVRVLDVPRELDGPLPAGSRVGTIEVRWRGRTIASVPLVTRRAISEASVLQRSDDLLEPHGDGRDPERARTR